MDAHARAARRREACGKLVPPFQADLRLWEDARGVVREARPGDVDEEVRNPVRP